MKIAFVNQPIDTILPPYQTSVGACSYGLACSLARSCDVTVYGLKDRHETSGQLLQNGVNFRFLPTTLSDRLLYKGQARYTSLSGFASPVSTSRWFYPRFGRQVAMELQSGNYDVIHVQHLSQYVPVIRSFNPKTKIVLHLHAAWFSQSNPASFEPRLDSVDLLTTVSDYVTRKTRHDLPTVADRCETMYNGIDANEFHFEKDYRALRRRSEKRILYAGAVSPHKGIHVLLDAFQIVAKHYARVKVDIIGPIGNYPLQETFDTHDKETIRSIAPFYRRTSRFSFRSFAASKTYLSYLKEKLTEELGDKVSFGGMIRRADLVARYYDADIFVFPPVWDEGFGIPPVEAMAAGTPVVASRSGAIVETVAHGKTGRLVDKNDAEGLAQSLLKLLQDDDLREDMGRAGRRRALEYFTWDRIAHATLSRYRALCAGGSIARMPKPDLSLQSPCLVHEHPHRS